MNPKALNDLLDSLLLSYQPPWDDCQQLLQVLFTTKEKQWILLEVRKNVLETDGRPFLLPTDTDAGFPLTQPDWNYSTTAGRELLKVYCQALMTGLRGAAKCPTNLTKVREVTQGLTESPSTFLERPMEAFRQFTSCDPSSQEHKATVTMAFIDQSTRDIRRKLQKQGGLQEKTLRELVQIAEKAFHNRETG